MDRRPFLLYNNFYNSGFFTLLFILLFFIGEHFNLGALIVASMISAITHRVHVSHNKKLRLEYLRKEIQTVTISMKQLEHYQEEENQEAYLALAQLTLNQLDFIQNEAIFLRKKLAVNRYNNILKKASQSQQEILFQTQEFQQLPYRERHKIEEAQVEPQEEGYNSFSPTSLPEAIRQTYLNIQRDHLEIVRKIEESTGGNQQELLAVHQSQMKNFQDILDGYLKIYQDPKDYYQAEQRMKKAQVAMEQFDLLLDETLRQLNETDMRDFEISLRILSPQEENGEDL